MASSRFLSASASFFESSMRGMSANLAVAGFTRAGPRRTSSGATPGGGALASSSFFAAWAFLSEVFPFSGLPEVFDADAEAGFFTALRAGGSAASPTPLVASATPTASAPKRRTTFMRAPAVKPTRHVDDQRRPPTRDDGK